MPNATKKPTDTEDWFNPSIPMLIHRYYEEAPYYDKLADKLAKRFPDRAPCSSLGRHTCEMANDVARATPRNVAEIKAAMEFLMEEGNLDYDPRDCDFMRSVGEFISELTGEPNPFVGD